MAKEKTRVDFNAPKSLVERADRVADVLDVSRTRLLIDALEDELAAIADDDAFRRRLSDAFYDDRVDYETVEAIVGREEALRLQLLRDSMEQTPQPPVLEGDLPSDEVFYEGSVPEWTGSDGSEPADESKRSDGSDPLDGDSTV